jgi:hypothetical protein
MTDNKNSIMKFKASKNNTSLFSIGLNSDLIHINKISIPNSEEDLKEAVM